MEEYFLLINYQFIHILRYSTLIIINPPTLCTDLFYDVCCHFINFHLLTWGRRPLFYHFPSDRSRMFYAINSCLLHIKKRQSDKSSSNHLIKFPLHIPPKLNIRHHKIHRINPEKQAAARKAPDTCHNRNMPARHYG